MEVRVLVANDSSLQPSEKQLIFEQLAPKDVELMDHALEDEHRMKVFALNSKKCWDDIFLAKDNAACEDTEDDIHQDVSGVEIPTHFRHDLPLSSKLAFCKHDQENIPTSEMRMICKDPQLTKFVDEPARPSALKNSKFWWLWNIAMNLEKRQLMEAGAFAWDNIKKYVKRALPSTMLITRKMNGAEVDKCKGRRSDNACSEGGQAISYMDTGYDKVKNLDPSHQILVIYRPCMDLRDQSFFHQNHCTLGQRPRTGSRRRSAAQSNLAFLGMWRCSALPTLI
jgi:hypothetical protein